MARPRLSPEEREARRKARVAFSFSSAAYQHYDPKTEGYGNADEWMAAAEALAGGLGRLSAKAKPKTGLAADLALLYLESMPEDITGLKKAYRNTLFIVHPDHGGNNEDCRNVFAAFERLSRQYRN